MTKPSEEWGMWGNFIAGDIVSYKGRRARVVAAPKNEIMAGKIPIRYENSLFKRKTDYLIVFVDDLDLCAVAS